MIVVRGARTHNLRSIDVDLPDGALVVITGPSGAGKSSLAFDTIFAEAERRYLEALSVDVRAQAMRLPRPDVDRIDGLPAAVAVAQRALHRSSRSTVGTVTEITDHLRVLYARLGEPRCPFCGDALAAETTQEVVDALLEEPAGTRVLVRAPVARGEAGDLRALLGRLRKDGYVRAIVDDAPIDLGEVERLDPKRFARATHDVDVVVDRLVLKEGVRARATDSIELARKLADGRVRLSRERPGGDTSVTFHAERAACERDGFVFPALEPALFSFNAPEGACPDCDGLGVVLPPAKDDEDEGPGYQAAEREPACATCHGARLGVAARAVSLEGRSLPELSALRLDAARAALAALAVPERLRPVARPLLEGALSRLDALLDVGLGHLALDRTTASLSGGEAQRTRIAAQLAGGLRGVLYVLDEPSRGMHPADVDRLDALLRRLRDQGSTVLLVEHDLRLIARADHVVDVGPVAGAGGGRVVASGTPAALAADPSSVTGPWLSGARTLPFVRRARGGGELRLRGVRARNLRGVDATFPVGTLICVTGPSGSGKTALVLDALAPAVAASVDRGALPDTVRALEGAEGFSRVVAVDASPIGRSPRASVATAMGLLPRLRDLFAALPEAKARGYKASRFSPNVKGGRCEACLGEGSVRVELRLLPDVRVPCAVCRGARFDRETLAVKWRGLSIADVLATSVDDAQRLFEVLPKLREPLDTMRALGLGYLALGQAATSLSGGEAQRIKLARELTRGRGERALYVLDEPTAGLHPSDVAVLLEALVALRDQGSTIVVVEHDPDLVARADHVIDLGPGAGDEGGRIVAHGPPEDVLGR